MNNSGYIAVDIDYCLAGRHRVSTFGSDKSPMKLNLKCDDCSNVTGKTAIVAYGDDTKSFGAWRSTPREKESE